LIQEYETKKADGSFKGDFKTFFTGQIGLGANYDKNELLGDILESCATEDPPGSVLAVAMQEVFERADPEEAGFEI